MVNSTPTTAQRKQRLINPYTDHPSDYSAGHGGLPDSQSTLPVADLSFKTHSDSSNLTALQQHVLFWDRDNDGIIHPLDVYSGFRELGFGYLFSLGSLLIPIFFSYPTRLAHSYIPDPFLRIYVSSIHKAKHGSDTGIYDSDGLVRPALFDELFDKFDTAGSGSLGADDLWRLIAKDRVAADPAGWSFAFMEWWTTWLLLCREGRVHRGDLRACYDGSVFWRISEERRKGGGPRQGVGYGYGWREFFKGMWYGQTWKEWEVNRKET